MPTPNPPKTTHLTPLISLDLLFPPHIFLDSISLSLFLWLGIQLHFTTSMSMPLFTASQIHYHQCETKMKRSQIGVRRRISRLLCVKSTSFSFFFPSPVSNFRPKPDIYPGMAETSSVQPVFKQYKTPLFLYQCTHQYEIYRPYLLVWYKIVFLDYRYNLHLSY